MKVYGVSLCTFFIGPDEVLYLSGSFLKMMLMIFIEKASLSLGLHSSRHSKGKACFVFYVRLMTDV